MRTITARSIENGEYDVTSSLLVSKKLIHGVAFATFADFGDYMFNPRVSFDKKMKYCKVHEKGTYKYNLLHVRPSVNILGTKSRSEPYGQVYFLRKDDINMKKDVFKHLLDNHQEMDAIMRNCAGNAITNYTMEGDERVPNFFYANNSDINTREITSYLLNNSDIELVEGTVNITTIVSTHKKHAGDDGLPSLITIIKSGFMDHLPNDLLKELLQSPERDHTRALHPNIVQDLPPAYEESEVTGMKNMKI